MSGEMKKPVLAMYDVRGKQEFIFRTNKIQEIVGGSWIIRDVFDDYLFETAKGMEEGCKGIFSYKRDDETDFSPERFKKHIEEGYIGEVVYDGGGNFILLFKDEDTFKKVTYEFTKKVLLNIGTLRILGTAIPVDDDRFSDYGSDVKKLYKTHRVNEAQESKVDPWGVLPVAKVNRSTSQPLIDYSLMPGYEELDKGIKETLKVKGENGKLTKEAYAKLVKYHTELKMIESGHSNLTEIERNFFSKNEKLLDNLVEEKGRDSKLAVIYIDGNNMGARVQSATDGTKDYISSVKALRKFSNSIQKTYVEEGIKAALSPKDGNEDPFRIVVYAGDEINFIVKAKDAMECTMSYLDNLDVNNGESACAGISVFHSHAPYSDAYRIAEEACESGKQKMKELAREDKDLKDASFIDFHIGQGAYGMSLESIREVENSDIISRPWFIRGNKNPSEENVTYYSQVERMAKLFDKYARSNIKGLAKTARTSLAELDLELKRIYAHSSVTDDDETEWQWINGLNEEFRRNLIYDVSISYDLWWNGAEGEN